VPLIARISFTELHRTLVSRFDWIAPGWAVGVRYAPLLRKPAFDDAVPFGGRMRDARRESCSLIGSVA